MAQWLKFRLQSVNFRTAAHAADGCSCSPSEPGLVKWSHVDLIFSKDPGHCTPGGHVRTNTPQSLNRPPPPHTHNFFYTPFQRAACVTGPR